MSAHTLKDRIWKEDIRKGYGVVNIEAKMKENHLRWIGYVQRRGISELVRKIESWSLANLKKGARKTEDD